MIRFGPAGLGAKVQEAAASMQRYSEQGIRACEIPFTYGVFIDEVRHKGEIGEIRRACKKFDIKLSIHAPYWINLNSKEKKKIEESKKRIIDSCRIGEMLGAEIVVFHAGFFAMPLPSLVFLLMKFRIIMQIMTIRTSFIVVAEAMPISP